MFKNDIFWIFYTFLAIFVRWTDLSNAVFDDEKNQKITLELKCVQCVQYEIFFNET